MRSSSPGKPATTPAVLVESASLAGEKRHFTTLAALAASPLPLAVGPVVMCVGEVFLDRADRSAIPQRRHTA